MISWILSKVSGKAILWVALSMFGLNVGQFVWHKVTCNDNELSKEFVTLAVNDALQKQQKLQDNSVIAEQNKYIETLHQLNEMNEGLLKDQESRGDRWKFDALKFKKLYNETRCAEDDEDCNAWGSADYRGDG